MLSSPWLPAVLLLLLTIGGRLLCGSWLAPSAFAALLWSTFVWVSMLAVDYPIYASAIWVIVLFVFTLQLGAFIGESLVHKPNQKKIAHDKGGHSTRGLGPTILRFSVIFAIIASAGAVHFVFWSFQRFDLPTSPISFLGLGHLWSVQRYEYGELEPWPVRLTIMWVYPAALLGGMAYAFAASRKAKFWSLSPLLPPLLVGSVVAARAGVLMSIICWISGYWGVKYLQSDGTYPLFRRRLVLVLAVLGAGGLILFLVVDAIRGLEEGRTFELTLDLQRLLKYTFGSLAAFSVWFHRHGSENATLGAYTLGGIFDVLGIKTREIGLYAGLSALPGGEETNIYTALRGLIEDFTFGGAVFVVFGAGLTGGILCALRRTRTCILFASGCYAFILCSPLTSVFTYNGIVLAWIIAALVLKYCFRSSAIRSSARSCAGPSPALPV